MSGTPESIYFKRLLNTINIYPGLRGIDRRVLLWMATNGRGHEHAWMGLGRDTTNQSLARALNVTPGNIRQSLRRLRSRGIIEERKFQARTEVYISASFRKGAIRTQAIIQLEFRQAFDSC